MTKKIVENIYSIPVSSSQIDIFRQAMEINHYPGTIQEFVVFTALEQAKRIIHNSKIEYN